MWGGRLTRFAAEHASEIYAFDPDAERVARATAALASELRERVRFAVHDAEALDLKRRRFDLVVIDTQPVSARPPVVSASGPLARLDMRDWARTIAIIDDRIDQAVHDGLFQVIETSSYVVSDEYDDGQELVDVTRGWQGTVVDEAFARRVGGQRRPVRLDQMVRLRVLRARWLAGDAPALILDPWKMSQAEIARRALEAVCSGRELDRVADVGDDHVGCQVGELAEAR